MCDCAEEQERREREAAEEAARLRTEAKARAAEEAAAARAARAQEAAARAAAHNPPPDSWFTWFLKLFTGAPSKPPARKGAGSTSRAPEPGRGPWYWMAMLLGTFALYFCLASVYCTIKNDWEVWRKRLEEARDLMLNPCAQVEGLRRRFNDLYVFLACHLCKIFGCLTKVIGPLSEQMAYYLCQLFRLMGRLFNQLQGFLATLCAPKEPPKKICRPKPPPDPCANEK